MSSTIIEARSLSKDYRSTKAVDGIDFEVESGRIVGLIGRNGSGKTTTLKAILGLTPFEGHLRVLGLDPYKDRAKLMEEVCFIADVAVLPRWIKVGDAIDFVEATHPRFRREKALDFLAETDVRLDHKVKELSKGMTAQLHLALVMAIDAQLLVLDEPTLGLDIVYRKEFYARLLEEYFDEERTILVTTHQVEEIEHILTDVIFIEKGELMLTATVDEIGEDYAEVLVAKDKADQARSMGPIFERDVFGKTLFMFRGKSRDELRELGELHTPSVSDLFVAMLKGAKS